MKLYSLGSCRETIPNSLLHTHKLWEFCINTQGEGTLQIGNNKFPFTEGTITIIPPGFPHSKISKAGFRDYFFHTDEFLTPSNGSFPTDKPFLLMDDDVKTFENLIISTFNLYYQKKSGERRIVLSLFQNIIQLLAIRVSGNIYLPLSEQIKNQIIADFTNPEISLSSILQHFGYSENYVRQKFKAETGITPTEFLTDLRIEYAKELLQQKRILNLSVGQIAEMCGFYDEKYFSRIFRAKTRTSPRDFFLHNVSFSLEEDLEQPV